MVCLSAGWGEDGGREGGKKYTDSSSIIVKVILAIVTIYTVKCTVTVTESASFSDRIFEPSNV